MKKIKIGNLKKHVQEIMAEQYKAHMSDSIKRGICYKKRQGNFCSMAPQGYLNSRGSKNEPIIVKDPERFPLVQQAFYGYINGCSVSKILRVMNEDWRFTTKRCGKSGGRPLSLSGLRHILENPFYSGFMKDPINPLELIEGNWEPMISEDAFAEVQFRRYEKYFVELQQVNASKNGKTAKTEAPSSSC